MDESTITESNETMRKRKRTAQCVILPDMIRIIQAVIDHTSWCYPDDELLTIWCALNLTADEIVHRVLLAGHTTNALIQQCNFAAAVMSAMSINRMVYRNHLERLVSHIQIANWTPVDLSDATASCVPIQAYFDTHNAEPTWCALVVAFHASSIITGETPCSFSGNHSPQLHRVIRSIDEWLLGDGECEPVTIHTWDRIRGTMASSCGVAISLWRSDGTGTIHIDDVTRQNILMASKSNTGGFHAIIWAMAAALHPLTVTRFADPWRHRYWLQCSNW
jgi:hypothetical protein